MYFNYYIYINNNLFYYCIYFFMKRCSSDLSENSQGSISNTNEESITEVIENMENRMENIEETIKGLQEKYDQLLIICQKRNT